MSRPRLHVKLYVEQRTERMHDAWRTAPDRAPGFSGSLIQGNRVFERQDLGIRLSIVWRASFYADSGVRVSTPPFEPIGDVTREAKLTAYA